MIRDDYIENMKIFQNYKNILTLRISGDLGLHGQLI